MRYIRPDYYEEFRCVAGDCPATCCAGWQIMIDEESLQYYQGVEGTFGNRVRGAINWEEGVFHQCDRRCAFLDDGNLCELYSELGPEALCDTCRMYPRHVEEFEDVREYSLSLSCPIAAKLMLERTKKVHYIEEETPEVESEDFEDFDYLMHVHLEGCRAVLFAIIKDRTIPLTTRMQILLELATSFQICVDESRCFDVEDILAEYEEQLRAGVWRDVEVAWKDCYKQRLEELEQLEELETLSADWPKLLGKARRMLYNSGEETYRRVLKEFHQSVGYESARKESLEIFGEQILMFFIFTYFCGAVYDDEVYAKVALAVFSVHWIIELSMLVWKQKGLVSMEEMIQIAYRYAREIEHSDVNLISMEQWFAKQFTE